MPQRKRQIQPSLAQRALQWVRVTLAGAGRLFAPTARGVYPPHSNSLIVLGAILPPDADIDAIEQRLWWRGLGIVERDQHLIAGADITAAVHRRRVRQARQFVLKQLRNAGVRGAVTRWDHPSLGTKLPAAPNRQTKPTNQQTKPTQPATRTRSKTRESTPPTRARKKRL